MPHIHPEGTRASIRLPLEAEARAEKPEASAVLHPVRDSLRRFSKLSLLELTVRIEISSFLPFVVSRCPLQRSLLQGKT